MRTLKMLDKKQRASETPTDPTLFDVDSCNNNSDDEMQASAQTCKLCHFNFRSLWSQKWRAFSDERKARAVAND